MRKISNAAGLAAVLCLLIPGSFAKTSAAKSVAGTIVIVFKDGHRQSFSLSDVSRVEFPGAADVVSETSSAFHSQLPLRGNFVGKWEVGDGMGNKFFMTLDEDGEARRSLGNVRGKWVYQDGAALVTWDDGAMDAIRKNGSVNQKYAYARGKSFHDDPDNVDYARNTSQRPI